MKIKMLYETPSLPYHMALKTEDGRMMAFFITPARRITEKDLRPVPGYRPVGNCGKEAQPYMYRMYGLEKSE